MHLFVMSEAGNTSGKIITDVTLHYFMSNFFVCQQLPGQLFVLNEWFSLDNTAKIFSNANVFLFYDNECDILT